MLRVPQAAAGAMAGARRRPRAGRALLRGRPDGQLDDALPGPHGHRPAPPAPSATSSACCAPRPRGTRPAASRGLHRMDTQLALRPGADRLADGGGRAARARARWSGSGGATPALAPARRLHALTLLTLFLTFDLTLFGAFTRLTDSGLGCPDWPGCYGNASPLGARARHRDGAGRAADRPGDAQQGLGRDGASLPGDRRRRADPRAGARHLGGAAAPAASRTHARERPLSAWWPAATLVWVCLQGAFGALTVTWKLYPAIVTLHLLGAVVLLALLCIQAVRYQQAAARAAADGRARRRCARCWSWRRPCCCAADRAGRLGQHQLRGAGLHPVPDLPGQLVAADELRAGLRDLARAGREPRPARPSTSRRSRRSTTRIA